MICKIVFKNIHVQYPELYQNEFEMTNPVEYHVLYHFENELK